MKKIALMICLLFTWSLTQSHATGIPVIDVAGLAQAILQVKQGLDQIAQLKEQVQTAKRTLENMSTARGFGDILETEYSKQIDGESGSVLSDYGIKSSEDLGLEGTTADLHKMSSESSAEYLDISNKSLEQIVDRFDKLAVLLDEVDKAEDQKDVLDLQARIAAEETFLDNEGAKLAMLQAKYEAKQVMNNEARKQAAIESAGELRKVSF
jgi:type IV secretion system protein VirB5